MELTDKILAAIIASSISLIIAIITHLTTAKKIKIEKSNLEKEFEHRYIDKLFEKRIDLYPTAFAIAGKASRLKAPEYIVPSEDLLKVKYELTDWAEGEAGLFMSKELVEAFYNFTNVLSKKPSNGENYSLEQADKIWNYRNNFRSKLRRDLGILHSSFGKNKS